MDSDEGTKAPISFQFSISDHHSFNISEAVMQLSAVEISWIKSESVRKRLTICGFSDGMALFAYPNSG